MRQLTAGGSVIALLALLGMVSACGSAPASPAAAESRGAAATISQASTVSSSGTVSQAATVTQAGAVSAAPGAAVKHADLLNGVSCAGTQCVAAGAWYYGTKNGEHTLVEMWTGKAWTLEPSPDGPKYSMLQAISCATTGAPAGCVALGVPVLAGYGSHWRIITAPGDLSAVACTRPEACLAVGTRGPRTPVFATWDGSAWHTGTMHAAPSQAQQATIAGVSCASADNCVAVGDYAYGITAQPSPAYRDKTLAEQWNGHSWRLLSTVDVSHTDAFTAVSCASADNCTAVGTNQGQYPIAERWNGKSWRTEAVPTVSSVGYLQLTSVSCPAAAFCAAVGTYQTTPVAETWNGTKWRLTELPLPVDSASHGAVLSSVSCATSRACAAVGTDLGTSGSFAELYAAGKWRLSATRNPT
jgi:hypothetical protein